MGAGYAALKFSQSDADDERERSWPYSTLTDLEAEEPTEPIDDETRRAIAKRNRTHFSNDRLRQLNYRSSSFVDGSTRGLTGIMSGMDPHDILESFVRTMLGVRSRQVAKRSQPMMTMSTDPTTRTRPGMRTGSKDGWSKAPTPKESDPVMAEPAYTLRDVVTNELDRELTNANVEKRRVLKRSREQK